MYKIEFTVFDVKKLRKHRDDCKRTYSKEFDTLSQLAKYLSVLTTHNMKNYSYSCISSNVNEVLNKRELKIVCNKYLHI